MSAKLKKVQPESSNGDVATLTNIPTRVDAFGKHYDIKQFSIGQAFEAASHVARMTLVFQSWGEIQKLENPSDRIANVMEAISFSGDSVIGLLSVATAEDAEWIKEQDSMEALKVIAVVIEKNLPLFSPDNVERIKGMFGGLQAKIQELGGNTSTT